MAKTKYTLSGMTREQFETACGGLSLSPIAEQKEAIRKAKVVGRWQGVIATIIAGFIIKLIIIAVL